MKPVVHNSCCSFGGALPLPRVRNEFIIARRGLKFKQDIELILKLLQPSSNFSCRAYMSKADGGPQICTQTLSTELFNTRTESQKCQCAY